MRSSLQKRKQQMRMQCPLPKLDYDIITLGHGGGGLLTNRLLDQGVFNILGNDMLNQRHDGAIFKAAGRLAFSTDSFVISPIFFPGGNIGELAVHGTVNDLSMCGSMPKYLSLSFIIEEGLAISEFWDILISIKSACEESDVQIITGDTKVVERGKGDKLFINTSGIGVLHDKASIGFDHLQTGSKIIISNSIAAHGMAIMSVREGLEFESSIESDTQNLNFVVQDLLDEFGSGIQFLRDPTRGGVAAVLNEIARDTHLGVDIQEQQIPIDKSVRAACEILGLDPLYVANEGVFVVVVQPNIEEMVIEKLRQYDACKHAAAVGEITNEHVGKVVLRSGIGGSRVVNMLVGEQLPRIC